MFILARCVNHALDWVDVASALKADPKKTSELAQSISDVHTWHHMVAWAIVWFIILHVYAALRKDIMSRQTMVSAIVSGSRTFRD